MLQLEVSFIILIGHSFFSSDAILKQSVHSVQKYNSPVMAVLSLNVYRLLSFHYGLYSILHLQKYILPSQWANLCSAAGVRWPPPPQWQGEARWCSSPPSWWWRLGSARSAASSVAACGPPSRPLEVNFLKDISTLLLFYVIYKIPKDY